MIVDQRQHQYEQKQIRYINALYFPNMDEHAGKVLANMPSLDLEFFIFRLGPTQGYSIVVQTSSEAYVTFHEFSPNAFLSPAHITFRFLSLLAYTDS